MTGLSLLTGRRGSSHWDLLLLQRLVHHWSVSSCSPWPYLCLSSHWTSLPGVPVLTMAVGCSTGRCHWLCRGFLPCLSLTLTFPQNLRLHSRMLGPGDSQVTILPPSSGLNTTNSHLFILNRDSRTSYVLWSFPAMDKLGRHGSIPSQVWPALSTFPVLLK